MPLPIAVLAMFGVVWAEEALPAWPEIVKAYGVASPMIGFLLYLWLRAEKKRDELEKKVERVIPLLADATDAINDNTKTVVESRRDRERDLLERLEEAAKRLGDGK